mmetsp:Transcript_34849/g.80586  ORF Transcript_34849/g.80586 Transcript_34849/m.80586 type:complete len:92 (+) Transcript_34849:1536-1811(+)
MAMMALLSSVTDTTLVPLASSIVRSGSICVIQNPLHPGWRCWIPELLNSALNGLKFLSVLVQGPTLVLAEESHLPVYVIQGKIRVGMSLEV